MSFDLFGQSQFGSFGTMIFAPLNGSFFASVAIIFRKNCFLSCQFPCPVARGFHCKLWNSVVIMDVSTIPRFFKYPFEFHAIFEVEAFSPLGSAVTVATQKDSFESSLICFHFVFFCSSHQNGSVVQCVKLGPKGSCIDPGFRPVIIPFTSKLSVTLYTVVFRSPSTMELCCGIRNGRPAHERGEN